MAQEIQDLFTSLKTMAPAVAEKLQGLGEIAHKYSSGNPAVDLAVISIFFSLATGFALLLVLLFGRGVTVARLDSSTADRMALLESALAEQKNKIGRIEHDHKAVMGYIKQEFTDLRESMNGSENIGMIAKNDLTDVDDRSMPRRPR